MAGFFNKLADKFAELKAATPALTPHDPLDKEASDLVDRATSDELIAPDWALNFAVVDFVNSDVRSHGSRVLKAIKRSLAKPNTKVQLLSLTLLETCVKNSGAAFHADLASSELWADVGKLAGDTSITRVDGEVRDKMLALIEDFARALQPPPFQATYETLLDRGVDFPVRGAEDAVPILTPPEHHHPAHAAAAGAAAGVAGAAGAAAAATAAAGAHAEGGQYAPPALDDTGAPLPAAEAGAGGGAAAGAAAAADPLAGVDEADRAAIAAALAELEAEASAAAEAERVAAEADAEARRQQQQQLLHQQHLQQQQQQHDRAAAEAEAAVGLVAATQAVEAAAAGEHGGLGAAPHEHQHQLQQQQQQHVSGGGGGVPQEGVEADGAAPEERTARLIETASNSSVLLSEMLASLPDSEPLAVRQPYVAELADACVRLRSRLERELSSLADETLMALALAQHEDTSRVLARYEELLAAAESIDPTPQPRAHRGHRGQAQQQQQHPQQQQQQRTAGTTVFGSGGGEEAYGYDYAPLGGPGGGGGGGAPPPSTAAGAGTGGGGGATAAQMSAKAAAVAAAFKEKVTGAFDRLIAAAHAARAPAGSAPSATPLLPHTASGGPIGGSGGDPYHASYAAPGGAASGGSALLPASADAGSGHFTLLEDEEEGGEGPGEGAALLTKRAVPFGQQPQAGGYVPPPPPPPPALQPQFSGASAAPPPTPLQSAAPSAAAPDLINFDEEDAAPPPPPPPPPPPGDGGDALLAGLTLHAPPPPPPAQPVTTSSSNNDQLVEALDRLVAAESVGTPVAGGAASGGSPSGGAAHGRSSGGGAAGPAHSLGGLPEGAEEQRAG